MSLTAGHQRRRLQIWTLNEPNLHAATEAAHHGDGSQAEDDPCAPYVKILSEAPQPIELDGLCQLPNGFDRSCRTKAIGPQSVDVIYQDTYETADKRRYLDDSLVSGTVQLDLDQIGRFHGVLTAQRPDGFLMKVDSKFSGLLLTKLARYMARGLPAQQEHRTGLRERSPSERIVPKSSFCTYRDQHDVLYKAALINISRLDAVIKVPTLPELNSIVTFCGRRRRKALKR